MHVHTLTAFTDHPAGGNPAGVCVDAAPDELSPEVMLRAAAEAGHSETVFVTDGPVVAARREYRVRYFSPEAEVPFCGHATIALGRALGGIVGSGELLLHTQAGEVPVTVSRTGDRWSTTLTSVEPASRQVPHDVLDAALAALGWDRTVLDPRIPPAQIYAGAWHLLVPVADRETLRRLDYDFGALGALCRAHDWVTVHVTWLETPERHSARDPFPYGGVVEDPATGAAAAAYGAYLRAIGLVTPPADLVISQGEDMGRPSTLHVHVPAGAGPVQVTGEVVRAGPAQPTTSSPR